MGHLMLVNNNRIFAATSTRHGGVSQGFYHSLNLAFHVGDNYEFVKANRALFFNELNIKEQASVFPEQTHSINYYKVTKKDCGAGCNSFESGIKNTDALYTREKNIALGIYHADCLPIFIYSENSDFIMIIHAGWQGSIKEITKKSLTEVIRKENLDISSLRVILGPAILRESLEVKDDIIKLMSFLSFDASTCLIKKNDSTYLDIYRLNILQLHQCGISDKQIHLTNINTYTDERFFSYRKNKVCGRHVSIIMLK